MRLQIDSDLQTFIKNADGYLKSELGLHSMIGGFLQRYSEIEKEMCLLVRLVDDHGKTIGAGIQTDPLRTLILSKISKVQAQVFAELLVKEQASLPGVNGLVPAVDAFAETWSGLKSMQTKLCTNLRLFELTNLKNVKFPSGGPKPATHDDVTLIFRWIREFQIEATPHDPIASDEEWLKSIRSGVDRGHFFLWDDQGETVCLVGARRETDSERWIAPVYTPKNMRGRGYASALTAFVSGKILDSGKKGMLFTDLANPTSNSIYQKIGYQPLADFKHIGFE